MSFRFEQSIQNGAQNNTKNNVPSTLKIIFSGRLDIDHVATLWQPCSTILLKHLPTTLILELAAVDYCDVAGITLLQSLRQQQLKRNTTCEIINLKSDFQQLLTYIEDQSHPQKQQHLSKQNLPERFGHIAVSLVEEIRDNIAFIGHLTYQLLLIFTHPNRIRWHDFTRTIEDVGPKSLGIVTLIGFLIGLISTFQAAPSFNNFGAQIFMINLVGLGLVREMGPLLTAVLLAGRTASAFAAEIGTMKINREIDALATMGINPIRFLVIPRVLAATLITPLLEMFLIACGLLGCFVVMNSLGYTLDAFWTQLSGAIKLKDFLGGLAKIFVFGLVIAAIGCLHGLKTGSEAQAVGRSTTQAVVSSLIMLVVVDGIFAVTYYVLGI